jgi:hypothetical protein
MTEERLPAGGTSFSDLATVPGMKLRDLFKRRRDPKGLPASRDGAAEAEAPAQVPLRKTRSRLFIKYVALFVAVVCVALLSNGIFEVYFYYQEHKTALIRIQREQAEAAAAKIGQFIKEIESQLGWTTPIALVGGLDRAAPSTPCGCCARCPPSPS